MDDEIKINFNKPMLVLKIRDTYKAPYHKNKYLNVTKKHLESTAELKKFLQEYTLNWSSGMYDLQFLLVAGDYNRSPIYSTFMRFDVREGKVVKIWKISPYTKKEYMVWDFLKVSRKKRVAAKKRKVKRNAVKKAKKPKKKVVKKKKLVKKKPKKVKPKKVVKKVKKKKK
ncbi:MAG: hypothetical protein KKH88_04990 [Nanoarchaeota archaeon]|nr:hypothetical protein [Nanoarchaeota archaeon]MBU1444783.1 hypothetical protein [Nanoarchaeota archaeon]MBU2406545.1 hypothetical protein [Nanoarchaeota archaeon]MBU2420267.1 hypothetical protein [Nanoarchaeota archaeon]MBU2475032.1 hypothetical protein [Nanoarchaeota archaeon]